MMINASTRLALFMPGLAGGGGERVMLTLAEGFVLAGHEVDLIVCRAKGPLLAELPNGVRLVDLRAPRILASLPALVRYLKGNRPEVMLSALAPANCIAIWARNIAGVDVRLIVAEHSTPSQAFSLKAGARAMFLPALMRHSYSSADCIVAVSHGVADDLAERIRLDRRRIEVIYNPVVTPRLLERSREPIRHPWLESGQPPVVLGVGRLTAAKDFPTLIRAFAKVRQSIAVRLLILGEGEERPRLEALVAQLALQHDVSLPGFVSNPYPYMRQVAALALSSAWEGFGNVLVEAMASGTPVVSTDCRSGPAEILEGGKWGRLVQAGDSDGLADAITEAVNSPRGRGMERANYFSMERAVEHYLQVMLESQYA
ncbi:MAG: glycosyltransferase [Aquisalimonadaceae bacterium]